MAAPLSVTPQTRGMIVGKNGRFCITPQGAGHQIYLTEITEEDGKHDIRVGAFSFKWGKTGWTADLGDKPFPVTSLEWIPVESASPFVRKEALSPKGESCPTCKNETQKGICRICDMYKR